MEIIKRYEVRLNLNVDDMFSGGLGEDKVIMDILRTSFEKKCMSSSYITEILNIEKRSKVSISKSDLGGGGCVCVLFKARAVVYPVGYIIVGCNVMSIGRGVIVCRRDNLVAHVRFNGKFSTTVGSKIIVKVLNVGYPESGQNAIVAGVPYVVSHTFDMVGVNPKKSADLTVDEKHQLLNMLEKYNRVLEKYNKLDTKIKDYFCNLFYPYKKQVDDFPKELQSVSIVKILEAYCGNDNKSIEQYKLNSPVLLSRHSMINKNSPNLFVIQTASVEKKLPEHISTNSTILNFSVTSGAFIPTLVMIMTDHIYHLEMISDLVHIYNTESIRMQHETLWKFYEGNKK